MTLLKLEHGPDSIRLTSDGEISGHMRLSPRQAEKLGRELMDWSRRRLSATRATAAKRAARARRTPLKR